MRKSWVRKNWEAALDILTTSTRGAEAGTSSELKNSEQKNSAPTPGTSPALS